MCELSYFCFVFFGERRKVLGGQHAARGFNTIVVIYFPPLSFC